MEMKATLRYLHIAPRKARLVANVIKGMGMRQAEAVLLQTPKRSCAPILKIIRSARANGADNARLTSGDFYIKDILVDPGPAGKRFRPRAFGRTAQIRRRTSHVSVILDNKEQRLEQAARVSKKEDKPAIRDMLPEDLREEPAKSEMRERSLKEYRSKPKPSGFIRRIFQRKVI